MRSSCIKFAVSALVVATAPFFTHTVPADAAPVKQVLTSHIGFDVEKARKGYICPVEPGVECQPGVASGQAGGFTTPQDATGSPAGNVYVADAGNHRIDELSAKGEFVLAFGKEVDSTTHGSVCTAASGDVCKAGVEDTGAGAFLRPQSVAVEAGTEDVYVQDQVAQRVDKYTAGGEFIWAAGKDVNETTGGNLCTAASGDACKAGVRTPLDSTEKCAFSFEAGPGDALATGGPSGQTIYVGDAHRVQELTPEGACGSEIPVPPAVIATSPNREITAIAADDTTLFVAYALEDAVYEFSVVNGEQLPQTMVVPAEQGGAVAIRGLAADRNGGHLAVSANEGTDSSSPQFGALYAIGSVNPPTRFTVPGGIGVQGVRGIGFNGAEELYGAADSNEVLRYVPHVVGELSTGGNACNAGPRNGTSNTLSCIVEGVVNPEGVHGTEVWFEWGRESAGLCVPRESTAHQPFPSEEKPLPVTANVGGLRPNASYCYRIAGVDEAVKPPEELAGQTDRLDTPPTRPVTGKSEEASFVTASSAVLYGEVNPENLQTRYFIEYGAVASLNACSEPQLQTCEGVLRSNMLESDVYGALGATFEVTALQPLTEYGYRVNAINAAGEAEDEKGVLVGQRSEISRFTTTAAAMPEATTGAPEAVSYESATLTGKVNPEGLPATFAFEMGVDEGPATQYTTVASGGVEAGEQPVYESAAVVGLQPGRTYLFRLVVTSQYIKGGDHQVEGAAVEFTTTPTPEVLPTPLSPEILNTPPITFPETTPPPHQPTRDEKLAAALKACRHRPKRQRAACIRSAHRKYGAVRGKRKKR